MTWFGSFYRSALGKKAVMAVTGIIFWGYVLIHMLANLKLFGGAEMFNGYAEWVRHVGHPAMPAYSLLWIARIVLFGSLLLHVHAAVTLTRLNWRARPERYTKKGVVQAGLSERTMRWSGVALLLFVIYHILHLTTGTAHQEFIPGDAFHNSVAAFDTWWVTTIYVLASVLVGMHLYHGLWSMFQSLGWNHPRYNPWRRTFAVVFSILVGVGFMIPPLSVLLGAVR